MKQKRYDGWRLINLATGEVFERIYEPKKNGQYFTIGELTSYAYRYIIREEMMFNFKLDFHRSPVHPLYNVKGYSEWF